MGPNRPRRIKHSVYQSLDENKIISTRHVLSPKKLRNRKNAPDTESYHHTYSLRGSRAAEYVDEGANYSEEEEDSLTPLRQRSAKRRKIESGDDDDFVEEKIKKGKSKRMQEEGSEEEHNKVEIKQTPRRSTRFVKNVEEDVNEKENGIDEDLTASRKRGRPRKLTIESKQDDEEDEEDAKEDEPDEEMTDKSRESTAEPRQYQLRSIKPPVEKYSSNGRPIRKAAPVMFSRQRFINNPGNRRSLREKRKRRSHSSSTSSSSDEELTNAKRDAKDEAKFQRRLMRSMNQSRQNLLPINMTEKDLSGSKHLVKERLRQIGQVDGNSCTDIDPMGIDKAVGFEAVGGCTSHLQSLKETVLFPLVYPELFEKFKITPPKGILFYGPPGTGKTLIARALANECSQGDKKVAFFMRKGADCLSKWIGESERQLRLLFDQAYSMRPSIIFFDEIDGLAPVRSSRQDQIHSSIVSTLLALMDGLDARGEVVVIGATNRLDSIDPALRRPGRFDRELRFSLPDKTARRSILDIHTKGWNEENKPSEEEMDLLAEKTSGYCGADLRSLCTEAVLVAIRNKFPHIYLTSDKLAVNPSLIKINQEHFITAMRNIVPACRRDVSIVSKQLNPRLSCLMDTVMEEIFNRIPLGYLKPQNVDNLYKTDLERVVRALEIPPSVPASRFLLYGNGNQGQTHYYLPVISNRLDHLCMHSISCVTIFSSVNPEESLNQILHAAIRSTSNGTSTVLLLPDIDVLQASLPSGCWNMLISRLESFVGFTSLLMIATLRQSYDTCSEDIRQLFGYSNIFEIKPPSKHQREKYFREIVSKSLVEPVKFNADDYPPLPKAVVTEPTRKLSAAELKVVEEKYENALRHFRIFLRDVLSKLIRDRRFNIFNFPVDIEDAEDYYEIIKNPLCLTEMMAKLNRNEYKNKQEFVDDICLIRHNAIEYNPETDMKSRLIRNNAFALLDITEALFEEELDDDFVEKLEEMKKMIDEAKNATEKSAYQVIQLQRRTRLSVLNGFKEDETAEKEARDVENAKEEPTNVSENVSSPKVQEAENEESKNADPNNEASNDVPSVKSDTLPEVYSNTETPMDFISQEQTEVSEKPIDPVFIIDKNEIEKVVITAIDRTNNWSIPQLESLGAALTLRIERYTSLYDRTTLPLELIQLVNEFVP